MPLSEQLTAAKAERSQLLALKRVIQVCNCGFETAEAALFRVNWNADRACELVKLESDIAQLKKIRTGPHFLQQLEQLELCRTEMMKTVASEHKAFMARQRRAAVERELAAAKKELERLKAIRALSTRAPVKQKPMVKRWLDDGVGIPAKRSLSFSLDEEEDDTISISSSDDSIDEATVIEARSARGRYNLRQIDRVSYGQ